MILHQDALIVLDYNPATDVLTLKWPDIRSFNLAELTHSFNSLVATIRHYDIKYLLVDARSHSVTEVTDEEYRQAVQKLSQDFGTTRLQKIARIQSYNLTHENQAQKLNAEVEKMMPPALAFRNFEKPTEASTWLQEKE